MKHTLIVSAAFAATVVGLVMPKSDALGDVTTPSTPASVSANPADDTPDVLDGRVDAIAQIDDTVYVGGSFHQVQAHGGDVVDAPGLFAFSASTGQLDTDFDPVLAGGGVKDLVPAASGDALYVSGVFNSIDKAAGTRKVAEIDATTGAPVPGFVSPAPNKTVSDLNLAGDTLYIGGVFTTVSGSPRQFVAALDAATGADTGTLDATFSGTWNGGETDFRGMDVSPDGRNLVVLGNFSAVDGVAHPQIARFSLSTTGDAAALSDWVAPQFGITCNFPDQHVSVRDVDFDPTGSYFVIVNSGGSPTGFFAHHLCDSASRWETSATGTVTAPTWVDYTGGDTLTRVLVTSSSIYVGGHQHAVNNVYGNSSDGIGGTPRKGLAALDPRNGLPLPWNPQRQPGYGVSEFTMTDDGLWMGDDTEIVGGETHKRLAFFPLDGGWAQPAEATGSLPGNLLLLGAAGGDDVVKRQLTAAGVGPALPYTQDGADWSAARSAMMIDDTVYVDWLNGTFTAQRYNGKKFVGPVHTIDLSQNGVRQDMGRISGMFYDKATGRIYYHLVGGLSLMYRTFSPSTNTFGPEETATTAGFTFAVTAPGWLTEHGLFAVDGRMYFVTTGGNLMSVGWPGDGSVDNTTTQTVSGPAVDGVNWTGAAPLLSTK